MAGVFLGSVLPDSGQPFWSHLGVSASWTASLKANPRQGLGSLRLIGKGIPELEGQGWGSDRGGRDTEGGTEITESNCPMPPQGLWEGTDASGDFCRRVEVSPLSTLLSSCPLQQAKQVWLWRRP